MWYLEEQVRNHTSLGGFDSNLSEILNTLHYLHFGRDPHLDYSQALLTIMCSYGHLFLLAGVGKSAIIRVASMHAEKYLKKAGDKPDHPRVLLTAHTGKAASLIGKSIHC